MKSPLRAACLAALLALASLAQAQIPQPDAESLAHESGLWEQLGGLGKQVQASVLEAFAQAGVETADSEKARVVQAVQAAYAPERLRAISIGVVAAKMEPQHLEALRRWFGSPTGQAIAQAEEAMDETGEDTQAGLQEGARLLQAMPAERRQLLEDLAEATHAADGMVRIMISTSVAVRLGAASTLPDAPGEAASHLRALLEAQRPQLVKGATAITLASFARGYAPIASEQLRSYVAFMRSPAGTQFNDVTLEALDVALTAAATDMGRRLPGTRDGSNV